MKRRWLIGLALAALLAVSGPLSGRPGPTPPTAATADVAGNNAFALELYGKLAEAEGNLALAPVSLRAALAMTHAGARGRTAEQMEEVLHLVREGEGHRPVVSPDTPGSGCELGFANSLWGQEGVTFLGEFLALLKERYGAGLLTVDFRRPEEARRTINGWVDRVTGRRIREIIEPGLLSADIQLVLANAVSFQGRWAQAFAETSTRDRAFHRSGGEIQAPTMYLQGDFGYRRAEDMDVLEMPYEGDALSMAILLPRRRDGLAALEADLTVEGLEKRLHDLPRQRVGLFLPEFEMTTSVRLKEVLFELGMRDAFDGARADLSGMTGERGLRIFAVVHKARVRVNEEGTEASAAGAVMVGRGDRVFRADHPFLFLIRDRRSGAILFLGRVADPSGASGEDDADED